MKFGLNRIRIVFLGFPWTQALDQNARLLQSGFTPGFLFPSCPFALASFVSTFGVVCWFSFGFFSFFVRIYRMTHLL